MMETNPHAWRRGWYRLSHHLSPNHAFGVDDDPL